MFSRIIPYLGELAEEIRGEQCVIVDLGANVGDTVAALIKHTNAVVLCIEPTDEYYHLLNKNLFVMNARERIRTIQAFISNKKRNYKAIVSGGGDGCPTGIISINHTDIFVAGGIRSM